ncbi:M4 family metallopeptidase [Longispora sp. K20-0274]|uniref:M4 family metallopeptidase n=1 Tax=Longispora sp. K20-0274 TaxID=3088255 RepID=UPI00399B9FED
MRRSTALVGVVAAVGLVAAVAPAAQAQPSDRAAQAVGLLRAHGVEANADADQSFVVKNVMLDKDGTSHTRMHRYYKGLPVVGGDLVVHASARGGWNGVSQTLGGTPKLSVKPGLSEDAAAGSALAASSALNKVVDGTQLVVFADQGVTRLAYEVVVGGIQADQTPSEYHAIVDAQSGAVLDGWDTVMAEGTGHGYHVGDVPVGTTLTGGTYQLNDGARGGAKTYDLNGATTGTGTIYSSASNVFGDGTLGNRASVGVDGHYGAAMTWDYYKNTHGRLGIRNDGVAAYSRMHYGSNYVNAFWSDQCFCMTYGDGDLSQGWSPLTSLDVSGHEMSHGVTAATAGLVYSGESGGINESNSDIFGTLVEFYANSPGDTPDYLIGEQIQTNGQPLRWMDKPSKDGKSADCWSKGVGRLNVHYSSGVGNHFFYLLAVGSGSSQWGNSPTCNGSTVTGIGNAKAGAIWYKALTTYMTSRTTYAGARTATLSAAKDLYGLNSTEYNAVAASWSAVSVN